MKSTRKSIAILSLILVSLLVPIHTMSKESEDGGGKELSKAKLRMIYDSDNYERDFELGQVIVKLNTEMPDMATSNGKVSSDSLPQGQFLGVWVDEVENFTVKVRSKPTKANAAATIKTIVDEKEFILTLKDKSRQGVLDAINILKENPKVKYAQPNYIYNIAQSPNDPGYSELWGMDKINAPAAWDVATGSGDVQVGVLDSGIGYDHEDLSTNVHEEMGYNAFENSFLDITDLQGHGTHIAGTIGADGNNSIGVAGVNWNSYIVPIKISDDASPTGQSSGLTLKRALTYAENIGLDIVNVSYEFFDGGFQEPLVEEGLNYFEGLVVVAAGNSNSQYNDTYNCSNLLLVGNSTNSDAKAADSSYGEAVDVFAPGTNILSTAPGNQYVTMSGTSMAAAHVTGTAALMKSREPNLTAEEIKSRIVNNVDVAPNLNNLSKSDGRLNAYNALMDITRRSGDFAYEITSSTTATITRYFGNATNLQFPSTIDGYRVTAIGDAEPFGTVVSANPNAHVWVVIPDSVETIHPCAFNSFTNLQTVKLPTNLRTLDYEVFYGCQSLFKIELPEGLTTIVQGALMGCTSLRNVSLPDSVTTIGVAAFDGCSNLEEVRLPLGLATLAPHVFNDCIKLRTIEIPWGVTSIQANAFIGCTSLDNVTFRGETPPSVDSAAFVGCRNLATIYVPYDSMAAYRRVPQLAPYVIEAIELEYTISGNNATITRYSGTAQTVDFPSSINGYPVTAIGNGTVGVITNAQTITGIGIPNNLKTINDSAFEGCTNLVDVKIPSGVTFIGGRAFYGCASLSDAEIPSTVAEIGENAFGVCTNISHVTFFRANPPSIGANIFNGCRNLMTIYVPPSSMANYRSIPQFAPYEVKAIEFDYTVSGNVATITKYKGTESVVEFPSQINGYTVKKIGDASFTNMGRMISNAQAVTRIVIPDSVDTVHAGAFAGCSNLQTVRLSNNMTRIGYETFRSCRSLVDIDIPDKIKIIGTYAFLGCESLEELDTNQVDSIELGAFASCTRLVSVRFSGALRMIMGNAFYRCTSLTNVEIPSSVVSIAYSAFQECTSLTYVEIPSNVARLYGRTFADCTNLGSVKFLSPNPPSVSGDVFDGCTNLSTIYVPTGSRSRYLSQLPFSRYTIIEW